MRYCRRCEAACAAIRESVSRHGGNVYTLRWYRCRACGDVSFSYVCDSPAVQTATAIETVPAAVPEPLDAVGEPVLSR